MAAWFGYKKSPLNVPGPSPWYLRAPWAAPKTAQGQWKWEIDHGQKLAGLSRLLTPQDETALLLDFGFYVCPLSDDRLLVWYESGRERDKTTEPPLITFLILCLSELRPYGDAGAVAEAMRATKRKISFDGGNPVRLDFRTEVNEGSHALALPVPAAFTELPEILVLADYGLEAGNHFDTMFRAIFAFDFKAGRASVIPQRWFNEGGYDFGYQWITRVQREQDTGQIVGEGIRLGLFRLNPSATQVQEWLHRDPFYHPENDL